ncbi:enolase C-terminal domain-like protein [Actinomadura atramentaria]|uniref:enolase C-terminal domain-like protein n=1 Tax=Actinomadura atramentaria TaxID=1990 RepID=UPI0003677479|nr:enolase C-terminal domain-like protein [Actinomadura atramentaria]
MTPVTALTSAAYTVPTDAPEADGTLSWTETTLVLVTAEAGGETGIGWTYGPAACAAIVDDLLAAEVTGRDALATAASHEAMCRALRNAGRPGIGAMALSAVDCALWDLHARLLDVPLHRLLGADPDASVRVYGSGGFTTYDDARTRAQLEGWLARGMTAVKIKIGEARGTRQDRDLERLRLAADVLAGRAELYADANGAYDAPAAIRVAAEAPPLGWFEEPVSSDDLDGLRRVRAAVDCPVAAGEYGYDLPYFERLLDAIDAPQADVTRVGGVTEFLRVGALARARNRELSAHCAPNLHAAVLAALPNARHIEWFHDHERVEGLLFDGALTVADGEVRPRADAPGHGLRLRGADAERYRTR